MHYRNGVGVLTWTGWVGGTADLSASYPHDNSQHSAGYWQDSPPAWIVDHYTN